jgi:hypothetical protein
MAEHQGAAGREDYDSTPAGGPDEGRLNRLSAAVAARFR